MGRVSLTGNDTHIVNGTILNDLASGKCVTIEYEGELAKITKGKNGNSIITFSYAGQVATVTYRLLRGSKDDKMFNGLLLTLEQNPPSFQLLAGQSTKNVGDGNTNVTGDNYILQGGIFKKKPGMEEDTEGGEDQGITIYTVLYGNAPRNIA